MNIAAVFWSHRCTVDFSTPSKNPRIPGVFCWKGGWQEKKRGLRPFPGQKAMQNAVPGRPKPAKGAPRRVKTVAKVNQRGRYIRVAARSGRGRGTGRDGDIPMEIG
jgi:hypothetical protein